MDFDYEDDYDVYSESDDNADFSDQEDIEELVDANGKNNKGNMIAIGGPSDGENTAFYVTEYNVGVDGSLEDLKERAGQDEDGNHNPLLLYPGKGLDITRKPNDVYHRHEETRKNYTEEDIENDPSGPSKPQDLIRTVHAKGKNNYSFPVEIEFPNLQGKDNNRFYSQGGKSTQNVVLRVNPGEEFDHHVMANVFSAKDTRAIRQFNKYPGELDSKDVVHSFPSSNGRERLSVRHTKTDPHPVIEKITSELEDDPEIEEEARAKMKETQMIPTDYVREIDDLKDVVVVDKELFNRYKKKCEDQIEGLSVSDVANPYAYMRRATPQKHFASSSSKRSKKKRNAMEQRTEVNNMWDDETGLDVGAVGAKNREKAIENNKLKVGQFFARISIKHTPSEDPHLNQS